MILQGQGMHLHGRGVGLGGLLMSLRSHTTSVIFGLTSCRPVLVGAGGRI